jgi:hypothetical protein
VTLGQARLALRRERLYPASYCASSTPTSFAGGSSASIPTCPAT